MTMRTSCASDNPGEKGSAGRNVDCETNHFMTVLYVRTSSFLSVSVGRRLCFVGVAVLAKASVVQSLVRQGVACCVVSLPSCAEPNGGS